MLHLYEIIKRLNNLMFLDNCQANSDCDKNEECVEYVCQYAPKNVGRSFDRGCNIFCAIIHSFTEIHSDLKEVNFN